MRTHGSLKGADLASGPPPNPPWAAPGTALGWLLFGASFPILYPFMSPFLKRNFRHFKSFAYALALAWNVLPASPEGLLFLGTRSESSAPTKHPTGSHWLMLGCLATKTFSEPLILVCRYKWPDVLLESESHFSLLGRPRNA